MPNGWRQMWLLVMYDLPVTGPQERKAATGFHDFLVDQGYERLNFSVYIRFCGSLERVEGFERRLVAHLPPFGTVYAMRMTDRQITNMKHWTRARTDKPVDAPAQYRLL